MNNEKRTLLVEKTCFEINKRKSNYENRSGKFTKLTREKHNSIITETCNKYNQPESTIRMVLKD